MECLSSIYPEIKDHLVEIDQQLISITDQLSETPHPRVKEAIFAQFDEQEFPRIDAEKSKGKVQSIDSQQSKSFNWQPIWAAASTLLLIAASYFLYQNSKLSNQLDEQLAVNQQTEERLQALSEENATVSKKASLVTHQQTKYIALASPSGETSEKKAEVYWNPEKQEFLLSNYLPTPPEGKQYQFWAIVDGAPQDMGVIPISENAQVINDIQYDSVDAFAITLEDEGGSPTPTLDQMQAIGKLV